MFLANLNATRSTTGCIRSVQRTRAANLKRDRIRMFEDIGFEWDSSDSSDEDESTMSDDDDDYDADSDIESDDDDSGSDDESDDDDGRRIVLVKEKRTFLSRPSMLVSCGGVGIKSHCRKAREVSCRRRVKLRVGLPTPYASVRAGALLGHRYPREQLRLEPLSV
mmetsp:Transcript_17083/g.37239  ORF Transcript_17083/g.37239 Transcript_17083/m.37239 type:complete len:165 (+) Transcript_17083:1317-1811(+)